MMYLLEHEYCKAAYQPSDVREHVVRVAHYARKCASALQVGLSSQELAWALARGLYGHTLDAKCDVVLTGLAYGPADTAVPAAYAAVAEARAYNFKALISRSVSDALNAELVLVHVPTPENVQNLLAAVAGPAATYIIFVHVDLAPQKEVAYFLLQRPEWTLAYEHTADGGALFLKRK